MGKFLLEACCHRLKVAHPHQSVDGNALLTTCKGRVGQRCAAPEVQLPPGGFKAEKHRRHIAQGIYIDSATGTHVIAMTPQHRIIVGQVIATQLRQRGALSHPDDARHVVTSEMYKAAHARAVHAARSSRRLLEVEGAGGDVDVVAAHQGR